MNPPSTDLRAPLEYLVGGGRTIDEAVLSASAVVFEALVDESEDSKMLVVPVIRGIGVVWMGPRMAPTPDVWGLVRVIDGVL